MPDDDAASADFQIEPECVESVAMFNRVSTQWRIGPRGPVGLDYGAVQFMLSLYPSNEPRQLVEDLQVMENAWLEEWGKRNG